MRTLGIKLFAWGLLGLCSNVAFAQDCPLGVSYPGAQWTSRAEAVATQHPEEIAAIEEALFTLTGKDEDREGIRTDGMVIIHGGEIIFEKYARGFEPHHRHPGWSVSKTLVNAITGAAIHSGQLSLSDTVCGLEPRFSGSHVCDATVLDLLQMASGVDWQEVYETGHYNESSVLAMLYGEGRLDSAKFVTQVPKRTAPGTEYIYSTGDPTLLMGSIAGIMSGSQRGRFPWTLVLDPIGASDTRFLSDNHGTFIGGSYVFSTPRDFARMGYLFLRDGCWNGRRILPQGWVGASRQLNPRFEDGHPYWDGGGVPGRYVWTNIAVAEHDFQPRWPAAPEDAFAAIGHWGQYIGIIPSLDLVVVRVGDDRGSVPMGRADLAEVFRLSIELANALDEVAP